MNIQLSPHIDWNKRRALEAEYERAEEAENFGECLTCDRVDAVLCLNCGSCFKYCHPDDECVQINYFEEET